MSQRDRIQSSSLKRADIMTNTSPLVSIEAVAVQAVRLDRQFAAAWPDAGVETDACLDRQLSTTLARCASGEMFCSEDDRVFAHMLAAISQTLDGFAPGYGGYFQRECTAGNPFCDVEQDGVRRLGELLKGLIDARHAVIDTIIAERELARLRRR